MRQLWLLALFACNGPEVTTEFTATIVGTATTAGTSSGGPTTLPTTNATTSEEPTDTGSSTSTDRADHRDERVRGPVVDRVGDGEQRQQLEHQTIGKL